MFKFFVLLKRFVPPYKKYIFLNLLFHLLSTLFSLFSFGAIIPILNILFGLSAGTRVFEQWNNMAEFFSNLPGNLFYWIEQIVLNLGAGTALLCIGLFLVVMTFFKTGSSYLGSYFMIPIRTGVLRDLRRQVYSKILSLPLGFFSEERKGDVMARMTGDVN